MANVTVSFNEKQRKEAELREWLESEGKPLATTIKDKLYEYKRMLEMFEMLNNISKLINVTGKLPESLDKLTEIQPQEQQKTQTKIQKRELPNDFML